MSNEHTSCQNSKTKRGQKIEQSLLLLRVKLPYFFENWFFLVGHFWHGNDNLVFFNVVGWVFMEVNRFDFLWGKRYMCFFLKKNFFLIVYVLPLLASRCFGCHHHPSPDVVFQASEFFFFWIRFRLICWVRNLLVRGSLQQRNRCQPKYKFSKAISKVNYHLPVCEAMSNQHQKDPNFL